VSFGCCLDNVTRCRKQTGFPNASTTLKGKTQLAGLKSQISKSQISNLKYQMANDS